MIWAKTEAGRIEMQARALVKDRATRNLLLVIDGIKSEAMLLANVAGIGPGDFARLRELGLIAIIGPAASSARLPAPVAGAPAPPAVAERPHPDAPLDYAQFTAALTRLISKELGLRGFMLTLAVEKASTYEELQDVARRALEQVGERKGGAALAAARRALYGE